MLKPTEYKLEDSNMALFGTDIEKNLKYNNAKNEPEWHKIDPTKEGVYVWRIEKFQVVPWPEKRYGEFYNGDTYIVLGITKDDPNSPQSSLSLTAFMWVGINSSKDETGTGAYKIVELDDFFEGKIDLVYEAQNEETDEFCDLFNKVEILEGGIESGFRKFEAEVFKTRLLKVSEKGLRTVELPLLVSVLEPDEAYILDVGDTLYAWRGEKCKPQKKFNSAQILESLVSSRSGRTKKVVFNEGDPGTKAVIEKYLKVDDEGHRKIKLKPAKRKLRPDYKMFKLSDESGELKLDEVDYGRENISSKDAFLIDKKNIIYVWTGKEASKQEKRMGLIYAKKYMESKKVELDCPIILTKEGSKKYTLDTIFA